MVRCQEAIGTSAIASSLQSLDRSSYRTGVDLLCLKICRSGLGELSDSFSLALDPTASEILHPIYNKPASGFPELMLECLDVAKNRVSRDRPLISS